METLVLVAAEEREFGGIRRLGRFAPLGWPLDCSWAGEFNGRRFLLVANGAGPRLAGEALDVTRERAAIDTVVSTGFCGALNPALVAGEIFVASAVCSAEGKDCYPARVPGASRPHAVGTLVSGDRVIQSRQEKRRLRECGGDAVDMEAFALAARAAAWGLPFYCIRAVTDTAEESFRCDLNAARRADGRISHARLLLGALRRPTERLPELWWLRRRAGEAARALGEFLADCRF